jgi:hypothetical protein
MVEGGIPGSQETERRVRESLRLANRARVSGRGVSKSKQKEKAVVTIDIDWELRRPTECVVNLMKG